MYWYINFQNTKMSWKISWIDVILLVCSVLGLLYYFATKQLRIYKNHGIKYTRPIPLIGNMLDLFLGRKHINHIIKEFYKKYPNDKYFVLYNFAFPALVIKDLELIKQITVKEFDSFKDHFSVATEVDPLFYNNLFALQGEKWHHMRSTLSPAFTGSKMKEMMPFMEECAHTLVQFLNKSSLSPDAKSKGYVEMEIKALLSKCTNDAIASCAFGIQSDSLNDPENQFYKITRKMTQISAKNAVKAMIALVLPSSRKVFDMRLMEEDVEAFMRSVVLEIIKSRNETGVIRRDMIHLLMLAMKGDLHNEENTGKQDDDVGFATVHEEIIVKNAIKRTWNDDEIVAQAVIFLFAGFETISNLLTFMCYELAICPDKQKLLREEIYQYIADKGSMVTYSDLRTLSYMDMVVSETLRLWPPAGALDRVAQRTTELPPANSEASPYKVQKGDLIWIPVCAIHRDPAYYPDPDKFIPERFSKENSDNIKPFTYLPFGVGPRSCIGNRFALMEAKILMFHIMANYEIVRTSNTEVPVKIMSHTFIVTTKKGFWMGLKKRSVNI